MVLKELSNEELVPDVDSAPGLDALSALLVSPKYLQHKDKEVRLYTCLACMEIFAIYAPEAPYDPQEVFDIFGQVISQLGNLAHTTLPSQTNYHNYYRLLEHLSEVKTGIVLVEYCRGYSGAPTSSDKSRASSGNHNANENNEHSDENIAQEALELLADLMQVLLDSMQLEHLQDVKQHAVDAIASCIGEFQHVIPIRILDVVLTPISKGPKTWGVRVHKVNNGEVEDSLLTTTAAGGGKKKNVGRRASPRKKQRGGTTEAAVAVVPASAPQSQLEQVDNISYILAVKVVQLTKDKCSTPIASLLNGVLNGDPFTIKLSTIVATDPDADGGGGSAADDRDQQQSSQPPNVWTIVYELHRVAPDILTTVIGTIATNLRSEEERQRHMIVKLLGKLFYSKHGASMIALRFFSCYKEWCHRSQDASHKIRSTMVSCLIQTLRTYSSMEGPAPKELRDETCAHLQRMVSFDPNAPLRSDAIHRICELCLSTPHVVPPSLLKAVGERIKAKQATKSERLDALTGLAQLYHIHYLRPKLAVVQDMEAGSSSTAGATATAVGASPVLVDELDVDSTCIAEALSFANSTTLGGKSSNHRQQQHQQAQANRMLSQKPEEFYYQTPEQVEEQFVWIARLIMESAWYTDQVDVDMRNRVIQIIDDVLWSNPGKQLSSQLAKADDNSSASAQSASSQQKQPLSATSRALGFAFVLDSLAHDSSYNSSSSGDDDPVSPEDTNAYKWLMALLTQRANLQFAISNYIDKRGEIKNHAADSVEYLKANNVAFVALGQVTSLTPTSSTGSSSSSTANANEHKERILQQVHGARDRHLFRVLATIATPNHSVKSRIRAFDDLPKRAKNCSFRPDSISWLKCCARRCAMGAVNVDMTRHLVLLAQRSLEEVVESKQYVNDAQVPLDNLVSLLRALTVLAMTFPKMVASCAPEGVSKEGDHASYFGFATLQDMLLTLRGTSQKGTSVTSTITRSVQHEIKEHGILTKLCRIMAHVAPHARGALEEATKRELVRMSTHDNLQEVVTYTVQILSCDTDSNDLVFRELFRNYTNGNALSVKNKRLVAMLSGLSNLTECFSSQWLNYAAQDGCGSGHGSSSSSSVDKVLSFALTQVLQSNGKEDRDADTDDDNDDSEEEENEEEQPKSKKRGAKTKTKKGPQPRGGRSRSQSPSSVSPKTKSKAPSPFDVQTSKLCAAITFLTCHVRAIRDVNRPSAGTLSLHTHDVEYESESTLIQLLVDLLHAKGRHASLPSTKTTILMSESKAAHARLRQVASLSLFRLIGDTSLQLDVKYPSPVIWHAMAQSMLEKDSNIRAAIVKEWMGALNGADKHYNHGKKFAPSLPLLCMAACCADGDNHHL
jgi:hypothetical protein